MFRDTSMDYLSRDEVLEIWNNNMRLTDEQLLAHLLRFGESLLGFPGSRLIFLRYTIWLAAVLILRCSAA